jgi:hypothetical protein
MNFHDKRRAIAERQLESGHRLIEKQRGLIADNRARGIDTAASERLLASLERSQAMFEEQLDVVIKTEP